MSGGFTAIDLAQLPVPDVIEIIDYETILADMKTDLIARDAALVDTLQLESEPIVKLLQVCAFRETVLRQRVNEAAKACMLAYALDADLDNLGSLFGVPRLLIDAGDPNAVPPVPAVYEDNEDYRRRITLALEGYSTAGPEGAYIFHALSADGDVLDASAISPIPGDVVVTVLSRTGDGSASQPLLDAVDATLSAESVRPLTDHVIVQSATITNYTIEATLYFYAGPGSAEVMASAQAAAEAYTAEQHALGRDVTLSGIYAALHQPGVQRVELASPLADIEVDRQQATYCTGISLTNGGVDE
ncbi:MAG: baseplate J/gp47 family protein [Nitrincola lacisaponensis]|uniref:baseplate assembly protein n=1 Tax=Nitrincola lacisaponensis TaxID=267850 RepID=UPI00391A983E